MIVLACDHGGYLLKNEVANYLSENNIEFVTVGCENGESVDYPDVAAEACKMLVNGDAEYGILICGTGIGISIAANKINGIRAALCHDAYTAKLTRQHNNSNVLCMGGRVTGPAVALDMVELFLKTEFEGGRHQKRIDIITELEKNPSLKK